MDQVGAALIACKANFKFFYDNKDQLLNGIRTGEVIAAMMWDTGGWTLNRDNPDIQFIVPRSGALGWLDTFALPARGRNDAAAYAWINFTMRPENAARVIKSVGSFSAAKNTEPLIDPRLKAQFAAAFPNNNLKSIHWYPAIPPGLEEMEGRGARPREGRQLSTPDLVADAVVKRFADHVAVDSCRFPWSAAVFFRSWVPPAAARPPCCA
jgi:spermidine/putrescine transport system substrate-binding protein